MTEQKYRAVVRTADGRQMHGTLTGIESAHEEVTATFTEDHIERPVPTTDENVYTRSIRAFVDSERPAPSLPTREQIAEALYLDDMDHEDWSWATEDNPITRAAYLKNADAVLALFQKGADR